MVALALLLVATISLTLWALQERQTASTLADENRRQVKISIVHSLVAYALLDNAQENRERAALIARHAYLLIKQDDPEAEELYQQVEDALRTIFRTEAIAQGPGHALHGAELSEHVCEQVNVKKALTLEEWEQLAGPDIQYEPACPELLKSEQISLRNEPMTTSDYMALSLNISTLRGYIRPKYYIDNRFEEQREVIFDEATGLLWQKSGSMNFMIYTEAREYVRRLNLAGGFAGYTNWRLPTVEELLSLMEPERQSNEMDIKPVFDETRLWVWSVDINPTKGEYLPGSAWIVDFDIDGVHWNDFGHGNYVRAVRSRQ